MISDFSFAKECFDYIDGGLVWKERPAHHFKSERAQKSFNTKHKGKKAGTKMKRKCGNFYLKVTLDGQQTGAHRVVWLLHHGDWPKNEIDHVNGDSLDNRIENLRDVTKSENMRNTKISKRNNSGVVGVRFVKPREGYWTADIGVDGRSIGLGSFKTFDEAVKARKDAERKYGYHENHGRAF